MNSLHAELVRSISTKFYLKGETLQFQIALSYDKGDLLLQDFDNYLTYKAKHDELVNALNKGSQIANDFYKR